MGKLNGLANRDKKLMVKLSCGHTVIMEGFTVSRNLSGNHMECKKCSLFSAPRRIVEKQWVNDKKEDY